MTQNFTSVFGNNAVPPAGQSYCALSITANTELFWPQLATGDNLLTDIIDVTSNEAYALTLPAANLVSTGQDCLLRNVGAFPITVADNAGNTISTLDAGRIQYFYITDNNSAAGIWAVFTFGTGTSAADASALAGMGLAVISGKLAQEHATIASTVSSSVSESERAATFIYMASGSVTCSLLPASLAGDGFFVNVTNQGTGSVIIDPSTTETIDGATDLVLAPKESVTVVCTGSEWVTIGYGRSTQFQFTKLVLDISAGSPFTLTSAQASNKLIQFIGTATAPVVIIVPAVVAIYYTECSYSGAFPLSIKTALGTGISLSGDNRSILYCDGVDVVSAQTASVAAANLSGGVAGALPYQSAPDTTRFSSAGLTGQFVVSGGTGAPTFLPNLAASINNVPAGNIAATTVQAAINELDVEKVQKTSDTGSAKMPVGTTAQRDATPGVGWTRFNTTLGRDETWNGTSWIASGGASGGGTDAVFYENDQTVSANYTITSGKNAMSAGPITIADGVTVTVPNGSVWSIV